MNILRLSAVLLLIFLFIPGHSRAQDTMEGKIERLEERVRTLEQRAAVGERRLGFNLGLFGDINFSTRSREKDNDSFYLGDLDLYFTGNYRERLTFLTEVVVEGEDGEFAIDIERLWIGYAFSDLLTIRAGRQHTALGYWNKTFHHGRQLFVTVDKPFFLDFEEHDSGVLPMHITGLELEGRWGYDFARFKYEFELGNGPAIDTAEEKLMPNSDKDDNDSKQAALRISVQPAKLSGLTIGVFGTTFKIDTLTQSGLEENIYGIDIEYNKNGFDFIAEYFGLKNPDSLSHAYYAQVSLMTAKNLTPYARIEVLDKEKEDPYLESLTGGIDRRQAIAGIRYDMDIANSGIKAQYRYDDTKDGKDHNVFEMQWSFGF